MKGLLTRFAGDESGSAAVEYGLIAAAMREAGFLSSIGCRARRGAGLASVSIDGRGCGF